MTYWASETSGRSLGDFAAIKAPSLRRARYLEIHPEAARKRRKCRPTCPWPPPPRLRDREREEACRLPGRRECQCPNVRLFVSRVRVENAHVRDVLPVREQQDDGAELVDCVYLASHGSNSTIAFPLDSIRHEHRMKRKPKSTVSARPAIRVSSFLSAFRRSVQHPAPLRTSRRIDCGFGELGPCGHSAVLGAAGSHPVCAAKGP